MVSPDGAQLEGAGLIPRHRTFFATNFTFMTKNKLTGDLNGGTILTFTSVTMFKAFVWRSFSIRRGWTKGLTAKPNIHDDMRNFVINDLRSVTKIEIVITKTSLMCTFLVVKETASTQKLYWVSMLESGFSYHAYLCAPPTTKCSLFSSKGNNFL